MTINYKNILLIVAASSLIGLAYNALNPKGIPLVKEERILHFENENSEIKDSRLLELPDSEDIETDTDMKIRKENSIVEELIDDTPKPFSQPVAIKLSRAYDLFKQGVKFIDSRSTVEFAEGHIKNAINIPFYESEKYDDVLNKIDKNEILVTYCSGEDCDTSILHGDELFDKGYKRVYIFYGGWNDWLDAGYPIESDN